MSDKKKLINITGFTLIEIMLFMAITGIFLLLALSGLNSFFKSRNTAKKLSLLQQTATYFFNELTQEVHWSDEAESLGNEIVLTQVQPDETEKTIIFRTSSGRLWKEVVGFSSEPLSSEEIEVHSFLVTNRAGPDKFPLLEVQLELEYTQSVPKILAESQTTISLRKTKFEASEE